MAHNYEVSVNETYKFSLAKTDVEKMDILQTDPSKYHILKNNQPFNAEVVEKDFHHKIYKVKVKSEVYEVAISDELDQQISSMGFSVGSTKNISEILAPMPGLILEIKVKEGDTVAEDSPLLILEAMKMENVLTSPREGVIKNISVKVGETVDKKQLLISYA